MRSTANSARLTHSGSTARHALAACAQDTSVVLASTDVDDKTDEITSFAPLLDRISDLRGTVITVDALHFQRDHVTYLAERGADWMLTVKGNQPTLHQQLAGLPWRAGPDVTREAGRGHGRRQIRTLKILTVSTGIDFPHAAQAIRIRRRRHRWDQPSFTTETAATGPSRTRSTGSAMSLTTKTAPKSAPAPDHKSWPPYATPPSAHSASPASPTSPPPTATPPATAPDQWHYSASSNDFAGALGVHRTTQGSGWGLPGIRAAAAATVARSSLEKPARLSTARDLFVASVHNASSAAS
ncbi:transposase IS4 family protein [Actinobacteria bacterium OK006]|nr:transposase IS4 family protein [Actinobacteria bacterium OK006]